MKNIKLLSINDENSLLMETNVMKTLEKVNEPTTFKKIDNIFSLVHMIQIKN